MKEIATEFVECVTQNSVEDIGKSIQGVSHPLRLEKGMEVLLPDVVYSHADLASLGIAEQTHWVTGLVIAALQDRGLHRS